MNPNIFHTQLGKATLSFETGYVAKQANGSVSLRCNDMLVLSTACASSEPLVDVDFLPLRVDYQEKLSSYGKTLGGYIKREGRPSETEILASRLIDRPIRPLFPKGYTNEIQLLSYVFSYDGLYQPDVFAITAASAALVISDIPFTTPVAGIRVGRVKDTLIINPTIEEMANSTLDLVLAGTQDAILMIEGYCDFLPEEVLLSAIAEGHEAIKSLCLAIEEWKNLIGKEKKPLPTPNQQEELLSQEIEAFAGAQLHEQLHIEDKNLREAGLGALEKKVVEHFCSQEENAPNKSSVLKHLKSLKSRILRSSILSTKKRIDGRGLSDIRPIHIDVGYLNRAHGSALFRRGETVALATATLGGDTMAQRFENLHGEGARNFYLQYSFPPFSVGEVGRMGPPGRREIGHGKLAERALAPALPDKETFPYVVRLESTILESNGSSSMASVCGGSLSMYNAGVPLRTPIAGIAMGLIFEKGDYVVLSDILGIEDALGDMDFKITGNAEGVTAFQLDIKIEGITLEIMRTALEQARQGRIHILDIMNTTCPAPKEALAAHVPRIEIIKINPSKIGAVIGPGGKQIRAIIEESGAEVNIDDDGVINVVATSKESIEKAKEMITNITHEVEIGKTYTGTVSSVLAFGVFVAIHSQEGLCHVSELANERVEDPATLFKEGDSLVVKVLDISDAGKIRLSHKATFPGAVPSPPRQYKDSRGGPPKRSPQRHQPSMPPKAPTLIPPPDGL